MESGSVAAIAGRFPPPKSRGNQKISQSFSTAGSAPAAAISGLFSPFKMRGSLQASHPFLVLESDTAIGPFKTRGDKKVAQSVVFGGRGARFTDLESDSWEEEAHNAPIIVPPKASTPPMLERQNSLLNDVRFRLEMLRSEQQMRDLELTHQRKKAALEKSLVDEEVQRLVTIKIQEMPTFTDGHSVHSRQSTQGRILRTAGSSVLRAATTPVIGTVHPHSPHNPTSYSEKVAHVKTYPSPGASEECEVHTHRVAHKIPLLAISSSDEAETDQPVDELSEAGSQGSFESLGRIKRPPLIIIKASDINRSKIRAEVEEHLPSPSKLLEDDTFTCAALPALYRYNTVRNGHGATVDSNSNSHSLSALSPQETSRPAPFLKTKSRSRILMSHPNYDPHEQRADSSAIVTGIARKHLLQRSNTRSNASQRFVMARREDSTIAALQSPTILEARFRGWAPTEPSTSSKHDNSTNFY